MESIQKCPGSKSLRKTYTNPAAMKLFWGIIDPRARATKPSGAHLGAQLSGKIIVLFPEESPGFACHNIRKKVHQPVLLLKKIKVNSLNQVEKLGLNRG